MFKAIEGFENYAVNEDGVIINTSTNHVKMPSDNGMGYLFVELYNRGQHKKEYVHRLVAKAFIPNPNNKPYINHRDGNPHNNFISNLEWCTPLENVEHAAHVLGVMKGYKKHAKNCMKKIRAYNYYTDDCIGEFNSIALCAEALGLNSPNIIQNANDKYKTQLKGMYFSYPEDIDKSKPTKRHERNDISVDNVVQLRRKGMTYQRIADELCCACGVLYKRLKKGNEV